MTTQSADGRIVRVIGPVVDVEFPPGDLPDINNALTFERTYQDETTTITAEVAQHLGDRRVRAICMQPTDGVVRGAGREGVVSRRRGRRTPDGTLGRGPGTGSTVHASAGPCVPGELLGEVAVTRRHQRAGQPVPGSPAPRTRTTRLTGVPNHLGS
jgi:hypothetical protein